MVDAVQPFDLAKRIVSNEFNFFVEISLRSLSTTESVGEMFIGELGRIIF